MTDQGYYRYPTINGDTIVFACEDDLFAVDAAGGHAQRLTTGVSACSFPRLSPDGETVAFVQQDEGHPEVHIIPTAGGPQKRLTYLGPAVMRVCSWSAKGDEILFVSDAQSPFFKHTKIFAIPTTGGVPRVIDIGPAQSISQNEKGQTALGRNAADPAMWKRYRGGTAGEIWVDAKGKGEFQRLIKLRGNMVWPMWVGGRVYFLSDHQGVGNIYSTKPDGSDLKRHSNHTDYYARFPSTDGESIVYSAGADLYKLDAGESKPRKVEVAAPPTTVQINRKFVDVEYSHEHWAPSPDGMSVGLIARGQPMVMGLFGGPAVQYGAGSAVRYRLLEWMADGERFVVVNDRDKFERLEIHYKDQSKAPELVTSTDMGRVMSMAVSPTKNNLIAVGNHKYELVIVNSEKKTVKVVDRSPALFVGELAWSPDGRWLAYSYAENHDKRSIKICDTKNFKTYNVTRPLRSDRSPAWDPDGNYLYFISSRDFFPVYDHVQFDLSFLNAERPYLVTLRKDVPSPFAHKAKGVVPKTPPMPPVELEAPPDGEHTNGKAAKSKSAKAKVSGRSAGKDGTATTAKGEPPKAEGDEPKPIEIDFDGIEDRILVFADVEEGRFGGMAAARNRVFFTRFFVKGIKESHWSDENSESGELWAYDLDEQRAGRIVNDAMDLRVAADGQTGIYSTKWRLRAINVTDPVPRDGAIPPASEEPGPHSGWLNLRRARVLIDPRAEWAQMYREAWRLQSEQFWDEKMSSIDWNAVFQRYNKILPRIRTRTELSDLIWEMQGELGTSHAYEFGGDHRRPHDYHKGFLGCDFVWDVKKKGYRIENIMRGDSWDRNADSPLAEPGLQVEAGDVIVAVNGTTVRTDLTVDELLLNSAGINVQLTLTNKKGERKQIVVRTLHSEAQLRYRHWVEANRNYVHEKTKGRVGYLHIPDMGPAGFAEFHRGYLMEYSYEGLIVDVRYNRGGHVSPLLLEKLARKRVGYDISRWSTPQPYPPESVAGPLVGLTNEFAGSDGDIFSHCFKLYKLGPMVGKRTWGGVIGIWPKHRLVDGTITTQPEYSFWFQDVGWNVENYGTDPDIEVDIRPQDYARKVDTQLDKGIELAMKALKDKPVVMPKFDKRPNLALPAGLLK
ncbi:MAG: PDZ domain-containing protein [Candidatus Obscuribacterales bacterium]